MTLRFYNTATRILEDFAPMHPPEVLMYNCGPTVYNYQHIGNMRSYVFADVLRRTLELNGYQVRQVTNITDVGHLVSDGDDGEDKMELGAKREGKSVEEIIAVYSDAFFKDLESLHVKKSALYPRATEYIPEQKKMITILSDQGYTYTTSDGIYFDTSKFPAYANFAKLDVAGLEAGNRVDMSEKKHSTDFALWKFSPTGDAHRAQEWDSPLSLQQKGFPGWHIECSAIINKELGAQIDIHTGGVDHIPVHHTNEIAQSESALGVHPFVKLWMHNAHILIDGEKMSKSLGNVLLLKDLHERGIPPLAFRYWLLTSHYRTQSNVTWEALAATQSAYNKLTNFVIENKSEGGQVSEEYMKEFKATLADDLNTANAIGLAWKLMKDVAITPATKYITLLAFDKVLGLGLDALTPVTHTFSQELLDLMALRTKAREEKNYAESDRLRDEIKKLGYEVKDTPDGQHLEPTADR